MTMRPCRRVLATALLLAQAGVACAQTDNSTDSKTTLSEADTAFIQDAGASGIAEVQMGQMALGQSSDDKIKALAQRLITDHGKADDALKTLATNYKVSFPSDASKEAQKTGGELKTKKGSSFDQAWTKAVIKDHQDAIKLFDKEAKQTRNTDLQQYVKTTAPTLKSHLDTAQQLAAMPDARDKAMDDAGKTMSSAMDSMPAAASTASASTVSASTTPASAEPATTAPASTTSKTTTTTTIAAPAGSAATSGAKH